MSDFSINHPMTTNTNKLFLESVMCILGLSALLTGILMLIPQNDIPRDILFSGIFVLLTLLISVSVVWYNPHLFNLRTVRLPGFFVLSFSVLILAPLPLVYNDFPELSRDTFLLVTTGSYIAFLLGIVFFDAYMLKVSPTKTHEWMSAPVQKAEATKLITLVIVTVSFAFLLGYIVYMGSLPVLDAITGKKSGADLLLAREHALKLLPKHIGYAVGYLRKMIFPFATVMTMALALTEKRMIWKLIFIVTLTGNFLIASATLQKSPVGELFIVLVLSWLIIRGRQLSLKWLVILGMTGLIFPIFVIAAVYQFDIESQRILGAIIKRLFYAPSEVLLAYIDYFPKHSDFLSGSTLPHIYRAFTEGRPWIENIIGRHYFYSGIDSINANAGYLAYLWVNFSWVGILIGGFFFGILLQATQYFIMCLPKIAPLIAFQTILVIHTIMLTSSSFSGFLDWAITEFLLAIGIIIFSGKMIKHRMLSERSYRAISFL